MSRSFGGSDYLEYTGAILGVAPLTMACWVKPTSTALSGVAMGLGRTGTASHYFSLEVNGTVAGDPIEAVTRGTTRVVASTTTGYAAGEWNHIAGVWASTTDRRAFLNGGGKGTNTTSQTPSGLNRTNVGTVTTNTRAAFFSGQVAFPAIWNVALTDDEIALLAAGAHPTTVRPDALVFFASLATPGSTLEIDEIGGFDVAVTGATLADDPPISVPLAPWRGNLFAVASSPTWEPICLPGSAVCVVEGTGGGELSATFNETITLSDSRALSFAHVLSESLALADARALGLDRTLAESLTVSDGRTLSLTRVLAESLALADSRVLTFVRALAESIALADTVDRIGDYIRAFSEDLTLSDNRALSIIRVLSDALTLADALATALNPDGQALTASFSETLTYTDSRAVTLGRILAETLLLSDARALSLLRSLTESLSLTDDRTLSYLRALAESILLTDATGHTGQFVRSFSETLNIADSVGHTGEFIRSFAETLSISDSAAAVILAATALVMRGKRLESGMAGQRLDTGMKGTRLEN